jgi:hypothetical protein
LIDLEIRDGLQQYGTLLVCGRGFFGVWRLIGEISDTRTLLVGVAGLGQRDVRSAATEKHQRLIYGDASYPRRKPCLAAKTRQVSKGPLERSLNRVLGILSLAKHPENGVIHVFSMALIELSESGGASRFCFGDESPLLACFALLVLSFFCVQCNSSEPSFGLPFLCGMSRRSSAKIRQGRMPATAAVSVRLKQRSVQRPSSFGKFLSAGEPRLRNSH